MIKRFADWLFKSTCHKDYYPDIRGDLEEEYKKLSYKSNLIKDLHYLKEIIRLMRWSLIKTPSLLEYFNLTIMMYRNYLTIAWRALQKNGVYSALNISGLSLGICVFFLSYLFVSNELSYDQFHEKKDRIFRLTSAEEVNDDVRYRAGSPYSATGVIKEDYAMVEEAVRVKPHDDWRGLPLFQVGDKSLLVDKLTWVDPAVFDVFTFTFLEGDPSTCLDDLKSLVITKNMATTLFGDKPALGKVITANIDRDNDPNDIAEPYAMTVTAVIEDLPPNSHFSEFEVLANIKFSVDEIWGPDNWYYMAYPSYVLLTGPEVAQDFANQLPGFVDKYFDPKIKERASIFIQPLTDIRLGSLPGDSELNSSKETVYIILVIASLVLALACVNFMNLTTARYTRRAKEVGLRKVIGAQRGQIITQFLVESVLLTFLAIIVAIALTYLSLPFFNALMNKRLVIFPGIHILGFILIFGLVVGVLSGLYPSVFLSSFRPFKVLKGFTSQGRSSTMVRKGLVIFQFAVTISLLIGIGTIYYQMSYLQNLDLDIDKEQYVFLRTKEDVYSNLETVERFKQNLTSSHAINSATATWSLPFGVNAPVFFYPFLPEGYNANERLHMHLIRADQDFLSTFKLEPITGRDFSRAFPTDPTNAFILNMTAVKKLGWTAESAIGKSLEVFSGGGTSFKVGEVIGVVKDFNFLSLHKSVSPLAISMAGEQRYRYIAMDVNPTQMSEVTAHINGVWDEFAPQWPAELFFMEEEWQKNYEQERRLADSIKYLTLVGMVIACLGLFGLASYTAEQKQKEISIRKVLGASVSGILKLISKEFIWLILVAFVVAAPLGWYYSEKWLDQFAYRINWNGWLYFVVMITSLLITFLTIGYHSFKVALSNPAETLRSE